MSSASIETPCVKLCKIDPASGLCIGCRRSLDEIMRWLAMSPDERRQVMDVLPSRQTPHAVEAS